MTKRIIPCILLAAGILCGCGSAPTYSKPDPVETAAPTEALPEETEGTTERIKPDTQGKSPEQFLATMSLDDKIHQLFIITPEALTGFNQVTQCGETSKLCINEHPVGGLIYFSPNLEDMQQAKTMLTDTQHYVRSVKQLGMFLAVDEEGGLVARVADRLNTTHLRNMRYYGDHNDPDEAFDIGQTLGHDIRSVGFNLDFAPVADINLSPTNELGERTFSSDPEVVANMVENVTKGIQSTGVAATLKHFPGLGAEDGNAHTDQSVVINRTLDQLRREEFIPFRRGIEAGADFVMVSHQIVTGVGDNKPACLSRIVCTELLREELGFEGIIVTDSMQMNTISGVYSSADAAVMAIQAGVDMILIPADFESALQGIRNAVDSGEITEERIDESVLRILREKEKLGLID